MARKQLRIFKLNPLKTRAGGGTSHLKEARFFVPKLPVHIVMRAEGARMRRWESAIDAILDRTAKRFNIALRQSVNVGNHLHLKIMARRREEFVNFLRTAAALIARKVTGAERGNPLKKRFWTNLAFTRVIGSRREEQILNRYLTANIYEAEHGKEIRDWYFANYPFPRRSPP